MTRHTLKTLARHLNLSVTTVSRALKDGPEVRPDTVMRVKEAAAAFGYVPNLRGIKLRTGRTFSVSAMIAAPRADEVGDGCWHALMQGMLAGLADTPYSLLAVPVLPETDSLAMVRRMVEAELVDGLVVDLTQPQDERVKYLLERGVPFVTFGRTELFTPHAFVDIDNEDAAWQATRYLLARGHRRIALLDPPVDYLFTRQRLAGYRQALQAAGLEPDPALISHAALDAACSQAITLALLRQVDPPTGFVCVNEVVTLGVLAGLRDAGRQPGADVELVSRDGSCLCAYLTPPISSCFLSARAVGERLASFLLRRIEGAPVSELQTVLATTLIDRRG